MPYEVEEPTVELHDENKFYYGNLARIEEEDGNFGPQLKWIIALDGETYIDDTGKEQPRTTWAYSSQKLTTHEKNKFRKFAKGLLGREPEKGEMFDERHYTEEWYVQNASEDPVKNTGKSEPWRVAVMFEHAKKVSDGTVYDKVVLIVSESSTK